MKLYKCGDGLCGATDCSVCFPGNEHEQEYYEARDEALEREGDEQRDREMFEED